MRSTGAPCGRFSPAGGRLRRAATASAHARSADFPQRVRRLEQSRRTARCRSTTSRRPRPRPGSSSSRARGRSASSRRARRDDDLAGVVLERALDRSTRLPSIILALAASAFSLRRGRHGLAVGRDMHEAFLEAAAQKLPGGLPACIALTHVDVDLAPSSTRRRSGSPWARARPGWRGSRTKMPRRSAVSTITLGESTCR